MAEVYRESVEVSAQEKLEKANDWAKSAMSAEEDEAILPKASVSQVGSQNHSNAAARRAVLIVKAEAIKKCQMLEKEEQKLRQEREELKTHTELL